MSSETFQPKNEGSPVIMTQLPENEVNVNVKGHFTVVILMFYLVLLFEDIGQLCVNLLCFVWVLNVTVVNQDEVLVFITRGRRHLQVKHTESATALNVPTHPSSPPWSVFVKILEKYPS